MSVITDAVRLIDEEVSALSFLPSINFIYIYWRTPDPSPELSYMSIFSVFIGAIGYNILSSVNFREYSKSSTDDGDNLTLSIRGILISVLAGCAWIWAFISSLVSLYQYLQNGDFWPPLLIAISILFVSLLLSELLLDILFPEYNSTE